MMVKSGIICETFSVSLFLSGLSTLTRILIYNRVPEGSLTILPTENYNLPFMGHKIPHLSSLLVTCHQSSRLYGVVLVF